jgi:hypothetical protein
MPRASVVNLKRYEITDHPARILAVLGDSSMRVISVATGALISTLYPSKSQFNIKQAIYEPIAGKIASKL